MGPIGRPDGVSRTTPTPDAGAAGAPAPGAFNPKELSVDRVAASPAQQTQRAASGGMAVSALQAKLADAQAAPRQASVSVPPYVGSQLDKNGVPADQKKEIADAIKRGDYAEASSALDRTGKAGNELYDLKRQLDFNAKVVEDTGGAVTPGLPPKKAELQEYFATFEGDKQAATKAADAFERYGKAFHKHPGRDKEVDYGGEGPTSPDQALPPARKVGADGKVVNDCEGFAVLGKDLLGKAGFEDAEFVAVRPEEEGGIGHLQLVASDENGCTIVVSNDNAEFVGLREDAESALRRGADRDVLVGYRGKTIPEANTNARDQVEDRIWKP